MTTARLTAASLLIFGCLSATASAQSFALDFDDGVGSWQTVVDGVMGGRSTANIAQDTAGELAFTGAISLENNGGFSQMRTAVDRGSLAGADAIVLECRGDGRTYKFDIRCSNVRMMAGAYQQDFETQKGEWTQVRLPIEEFVLYSFGRKVRRAPELETDKINSIGITLADKNEGAFRLDVRSIRAVSGDSGNGNTDAPANSGRDLASVAKAAGLTTLLDLVGKAELALPKTPVTIFAPTNEAFAALPKATVAALLKPEGRDALRDILTFHVVAGANGSADVLNVRTLPSLNGQPLAVDPYAGRIAGAGLVALDVPFDGGIVHVIDKVMLPEQRPISQIASETEQLSTLMAAVNSAKLARQLERQNGPWTIFAPVNSAFADLPKGTVESLLEPQNRRKLTSILGLHVVPGRIAARELLAKKRLTSLMGRTVDIGRRDGRLVIGEGARIVTADIQASNGVIHLIDSVLLPKQEDPAEPTVITRTQSPTDLRDAVLAVYSKAVERGAPLFNEGNPDACAAIYEVAVEAMLALASDDLSDKAIERLLAARKEANNQESGRARAWALRRGLDDVYRMLEQTQPRGELRDRTASSRAR